MTTILHPETGTGSGTERGPARIGAVSYLNTLPLIEGLGKLEGAELTLTAPSQLIDLLVADEIDIGLVSVIDAQRSPEPMALAPEGMIGCDGPTLTVRLFSAVPIDQITTVHADVDSHTSIALLRVILGERFGIKPRIEDFDVDAHRAALSKAAVGEGEAGCWPEALLLIGDKVVTDSPPAIHYQHQVDLGEAWKELTGRPFVYAIWMCRASSAASPEVTAARSVLDRQRRHNSGRIDWIIRQRADARGWPEDLARRYLVDLLRYEVRQEHRDAIEAFFDLCARHGVLDSRRETVWA